LNSAALLQAVSDILDTTLGKLAKGRILAGGLFLITQRTPGEAIDQIRRALIKKASGFSKRGRPRTGVADQLFAEVAHHPDSDCLVFPSTHPAGEQPNVEGW
jgi:hypothetical protein